MGELLLLVAAGGAAGIFGALLGLGGGILIVPLLTLGFGLPFREAVGTSLVCVIVTSSAAKVASASTTATTSMPKLSVRRRDGRITNHARV